MINKFLIALLALSIASNAFGAPPVITDLAAGTPTVNSIPLSWSVASGGSATAYEMRYSTVPFDAGSFAAAVPLGGVPAPTGGTESHTASGLACGTPYWFAVKAFDADGATAVSNVAGGATLPCAPSFTSSPAITGASSLYSFTKGDFNNDGKLDLAFTVGSGTTGNIVFYPGDGSGGFGVQVTSTEVTGNYPLTPSAGDFNRDGRLDLAVPNFSSNNVSILLGDGAGGFPSGVTVSTGDEPQDIAVNDFNRDGNPDIAVALWGGHAVAVFLGDGNSGFILKGNYGGYDGDARLNSIRSADLNGDGILDILVADPGVPPYRSKIGVLIGNGDGSFKDRVEYTVGNLPGTISIGDLNRDGHPDIVATSYSENLLAVFTGDGNGTFSVPTTYAIGGNAVFSGITDFNGDGIPDIAVGRDSDNTLLLLTGKGNGSFNDPLSIPVGGNIRQAISDDFNGDGKPDAVVLATNQTTVYSLLNTTAWSPAGSFFAAPSLATGTHPSMLKTADLNGDGRLDLVTTNEEVANADVFYGNGDGTFQTAVTLSAGLSPDALTIADFNRDGRQDLLLINDSGSVYRYDNIGSGFSGPTPISFGNNNDDVTSADINRDGIPDLVLVYSNGDGSNSRAAVRFGDGAGGFGAEAAYTAGSYAISVAAGDFKHDGITDLAIGNFSSANVSILVGKNDGTFNAAENYPSGSNPVYLASADFNGDGRPDLAVPNCGGATVSVLMGNGDGAFQEKTDYAAGVNPQAVVVGDIDRDGRPDLVVARRGGSSIDILRGRGDGTFHPAESVTAGSSPIYPALGDFNGDGKTDIAVANYESSTVSIFLNTAPLPTVPQEGLVALWRAENNALDSIGGNHGAPQGGIGYSTGRYGQAFSLDGTDDNVEIPDATALNPASAITVEAWYRPVSFAGNGSNAIVSKGYSSHAEPYYEYHLGVNGDQYVSQNSRPGSFSFTVSPGGTRVAIETAANTWIPGNWYHLVGTYDGANVRLYVNGVLQASTAATGALNDYGKSVRIGAFNNISTSIDYTPGVIDEVAIYSRALTPEEIASISSQVPNSFSFIDQTGVPINTDIVSNPITVTGINYPAAVSINGGDYSISTDGGTTWGGWTNSAGTVSLNNQVKVRQTSSSDNLEPTTATLTIGGVSALFNVTTADAGDPNALGLVAWWKGENNAFDSIGGNHGTLHNGASFAAGQVGQAFSFDGEDDYLDTSSAISIRGLSRRSIQAWVKVNSFDGKNQPVFVETIAGYGQHEDVPVRLQLVIRPDGSIEISGRDSDVFPSEVKCFARAAAGVVPAGQFVHVAGIYDGIGGEHKVFVNGVNATASTEAGGTFPDTDPTVNPRIGNDTTDSFNGIIDELHIFNRALSPSEVSNLAGTYPDAFSFSAKTGQELSTPVESNTINVSGITQPASISISAGGEYSISSDGTNWTPYSSTNPATISVNNQVRVRLTSSSSYLDTKTTTLTIGGREGIFSVTTREGVKPEVTGFALAAAESINMSIGITTFDATDNSGTVSGYMITSSNTPPLATDLNWSATAPTSFTLTTAGANTLYAWAKDPAGNVSNPIVGVQVLLKPVRRDPAPYIYYDSISAACSPASSGETIKALAVTVPGIVTITGKTLTIKGGHADGYGSQPGVTTIGTLTVETGSLIVDRVAIR